MSSVAFFTDYSPLYSDNDVAHSFPLANDAVAPCGLAKSDESDSGNSDIVVILCVVEDLEVANIILHIGRDERVFGDVESGGGKFSIGPFAVVGFDEFFQVMVARVAGDEVEADL